jgi:formate dehydrogenase iron-sulfur subunit
MDRRKFLKLGALTGAVAPATLARSVRAAADEEAYPEFLGMLIDTTRCIGCQSCEVACATENGLPYPEIAPQPVNEDRPTTLERFTLVNRFDTEAGPVWVKKACNHCSQPACATACLVKAMEKTKEGPVVWHADRCMGCRYCMVACPFDVPKFEYHEAFPIITKCTLCYEGRTSKGLPTACSEACPQDAIVFGTRRELHEEAWRRITSNPDAYNHHVYGRREVGGTEVMYLAPVDFAGLGFRKDLGQQPYSELPREFLYSVPMILTILPALLFGISMGVQGEKDKEAGR